MAQTEDDSILSTLLWTGLAGQDIARGALNPDAKWSATARTARRFAERGSRKAAEAATKGTEAASKTRRAATATRRGYETAKAAASRTPRVLRGAGQTASRGREALNASRVARAANESRAARLALGGGGRIASKITPALWALEAGITGAQIGEALYGTQAGKAYAEGVNDLPVIGDVLGDRGDNVLEEQEAKGLLGTLGRAFAALPFGPSHELPQTYQQETGNYAPADTDKSGYTSKAEADAAIAKIKAEKAAKDQQEAVGDPTMAILDEVQAMLEAQSAATDIGFEDKVSQLREVFSLTEDPNEQAELAFILGDLEAQREGAMGAIANAFGQAKTDVDRFAGQTGSGAAAGAAYTDAAGAAEAALAEMGDYGADTGLGVAATDMTGDITAMPGDFRQQGANNQALGDALSASATTGLNELGVSLGRQNAAQQGALQRAYLGERAGAIRDDAARQAAEQDAFRQAALSLWMDEQAGGGNPHLSDIIDIMLQKASVLEARRGEGTTWQPTPGQQEIEWLSLLAEQNPAAIEALVEAGEITREQADAFLGLTPAP